MSRRKYKYPAMSRDLQERVIDSLVWLQDKAEDHYSEYCSDKGIAEINGLLLEIHDGIYILKKF